MGDRLRRPTGFSFAVLVLSILVLILSAQLPSAGVGLIGIFILVFGIAHSYQGISGILSTGLMGGILALVYLKSGRNIWLPILLHGWVDTFGLYFIYAGIDQQLLNV